MNIFYASFSDLLSKHVSTGKVVSGSQNTVL